MTGNTIPAQVVVAECWRRAGFFTVIAKVLLGNADGIDDDVRSECRTCVTPTRNHPEQRRTEP